LVGIILLRDKSVPMPQNQDIEITPVDIVETTVANGLAIWPIAMHWLVVGCDKPVYDGLSLHLQIQDGG
jgi:hypothetical protein